MWRGDEDTRKANFRTPWFCLCVDPGTVPCNASSTKLAWPPSSPFTSRLHLHFLCPSVTVSPHFMHTSLPPNVSYLREAGTPLYSYPSFWWFRTLLIIVLNNSSLNWVKTNQTESHGGQVEDRHFWYEENGLGPHRKASSRNSTAQPSVSMCSIWPSEGFAQDQFKSFSPKYPIELFRISHMRTPSCFSGTKIHQMPLHQAVPYAVLTSTMDRPQRNLNFSKWGVLGEVEIPLSLPKAQHSLFH